VGSHPAGASRDGVQDLAGNAAEWVHDRFAESFSSDDVRDPTGSDEGTKRVIRGGGWQDPAMRLKAAARMHAAADSRFADVGFRCARAVTDR
jgi:formylglycine-generating enzyme required for sulfatase activity